MSNLDSALVADARAFVASKFGGNDMTGVPVDAIKNAVESLYSGGWIAYVADFRRFTQTASVNPVEAFSPMKQRAIVGAMTKRALRDYDDIIVFNFNPLESATFVVSRPSAEGIDRRTSRDIITEREITLYKYTCTPGSGWSVDSITITEAVNEVHHRFGSIMTVERAADKKEQYDNCYRPGGDKTPLQGWVARLEMSWKQAHETEVFQSPNSTQKG